MNEPWDFAKDTVRGNMTLYAKWAEGEKPAEIGSYGMIGLIAVLIVAAAVAVWMWMKKKKGHNAQ